MAVSDVSFTEFCYQGRSNGLSPDSSLTKIWKFSDGDEDVDVEEAFDDEREKRMFG